MTSRLVVGALVSLSACTHPPRPALVGQGNAIVQARSDGAFVAPATPWTVGTSMQLAAGAYDVAMQFDLPRAQRLDWTLTCAGTQQADTVRVPRRARVVQTSRIVTTSQGVCAVVAIAEDGDVVGTYRITRATTAPVAMTSTTFAEPSVVGPASGAPGATSDPIARATAEARVRDAADARAAVELDAARLRERDEVLRISALRARVALRDRTVAHGADPTPRRTPHVAPIDPQQQRLDHALAARTALRTRFVHHGAIVRPLKPAVIAETRGEPPFVDAVWTDGRWIWVRGQWMWHAGGWDRADVEGDDGFYADEEIGTFDLNPDLGVAFNDDIAEGGLYVTLPDGTQRARIPHRASANLRVRDHRAPRVRDHRASRASAASHDRGSAASSLGDSGSSSRSSSASKPDDPDAKNDASAGTFSHQH